MKRRGVAPAWISPNSNSKFNEDSENQNPNLSTPQNNQAKVIKAAIKSSTEKKEAIDEPLQQNNETFPRLKATLSARNLFAGRDILNQITEFCNELKRMATRTRERESVKEEKSKGEVLGELDWRGGNEKKIFLDGVNEKPQEIEKNILKEKPRRKK